MPRNVTSYDVAKLAGVSQATVSYVLSGNTKQSISEVTREKILKAAQQLGYYPNSAAKSLRRRKNLCVSVMVNKQLELPRYAGVVQGLREVLESHGYSVLLCSEGKETGKYPQYICDFLENRVDGIIYIGADGKVPEVSAREAIQTHKIPFVAYDCRIPEETVATVDLDYAHGIRDAMRALVQSGCTKLLYVYPNIGVPQEVERLEAFREWCHVHQVPNDSCPMEMRNYLSDSKKIMEMREHLPSAYLSKKSREQTMQQWRTVAERIGACDRTTGIIFAWSWTMNIGLEVLAHKPDKPMLAVLTGENTGDMAYQFYGQQIYYSELPNEESGAACARSILRQLNEEGRAEKIILRPRLKAIL